MRLIRRPLRVLLRLPVSSVGRSVLLIRRTVLLSGSAIPLVLGSLVLLTLVALTLVALTLVTLTLIVLTLVALTLRLTAALLHLRVARLPLLTQLTLLVARQNAHELLAHRAVRGAVLRASFGMRLSVLVDDRLDAPLLIAGKVQPSESTRPVALHAIRARHRPVVSVAGARRLRLLGADADRRRERHREHAHCEEVRFHTPILACAGQQARESGIRTGQAV